MTTTPSTDLQELLAARRGDGAAPVVVPPGDDPPVDTATGEILPVGSGAAAPPLPPVAVEPDDQPDYTLIPPKVLGAIPFAEGYWRMAGRVCSTEFTPDKMRGRREAVVAVFMAGYEMGMGPMQALASFDVIGGKVVMKPEAMRALVMHEGHTFILREGTDPDEGRYAEAECRRSDWPEGQSETYRYSMMDAQLAGLSTKDNWKKMPRAMLDARTTGGAARRYFPDVIQGMSYTPEEIGDSLRDARQPTPEAPSAPEPVAAVPEAVDAPAKPPADTPPIDTTAVKRKRGRPTKKEAEARKAAEEEAQRQPLEPEPGPPEPPEEPPGPPVGPAKRVDHDPPPEEPPDVERVPDPVQSPLGTLIPPEPEEPAPPPLLPGEASVIGELRKSLAALIKAQPDLQQKALRAFLGAHFPGKKATDLDADQLTLAINIAGDWPESIEQYPAPEPPPSEF